MVRKLLFYARATELFVTIFFVKPLRRLFLPALIDAPPAVQALARYPQLFERICVIGLLLFIINPWVYALNWPLSHLPAGFLILYYSLRKWVRRRLTRFEKTLYDNDLAHCLTCGYCLFNLPESHVCPECGTAYDLYETRQAWLKYFRVNRKQI